MRAFYRLCRCLPAITLLFCSAWFFASSNASASAEIASWLEQYTTELARNHELAGVSTAVTLPDGTTLRAAAGIADLASGKPLQPDHRMLGGSTGKTYVAALVLAMAEQGELDLDAKLESYLGETPWYARLPNAGSITVQSLLNHSTGIAHYIHEWDFRFRFAFDRLLGRNTAYTPERMLSFVFDESALFPVGTDHHYSDLNYFLLGLLIETVSGQSYYDLLQSQVLDYLALQETTPSNRRRIEKLATGYTQSSLLNLISGTAGASMVDGELTIDPSIEWAGGGLATTPGDLARFFFHLGSGNVLGIDGLESLSHASIAVAASGNTRYGNGVYISDREQLGAYFSHSGWYPGYTSNVAYFHDHGFSVAVQVSQDSNVDIYTPVREIAQAMIARLPRNTRLEFDYELIIADKHIGSQKLIGPDENNLEIFYDYTSQGKVVDIDIAMALDNNGTPRSLTRTGQSFLYRPINEHFEASGDTARWHNHLERQRSAPNDGQYYVSYDLLDDGASAPAETALLARSALSSATGSIELLPSGEAQAEVLGWHSVRATDSAVSLETRLVALDGLGLSPSYLWLDVGGFSFAEHSGGSIIRAGWRDSIASQAARQDELVRRKRKDKEDALRQTAFDSFQRDLRIENVRVFDSESLTFSTAQQVVIRGGRILSIGESSEIEPAVDTQTIDGNGKFMIPGLWDMHVHLGHSDLLKHLAWGVTTVRDMGNQRALVDTLYRNVESNKQIGPQILRAGFIDKSGPYETAAGVLVTNLEEALQAVDAYADADYDQIKLYGAIDADWVKPLAELSKQHGLRLSGHVPINGSTERAIADGYNEITHFIYLWLNFAPEPVALELTYNTAELAAEVPVNDDQMNSLIKRFADGGVALDPTLAVYADLLIAEPGELKRSFQLLNDTLPVQTARAARSGALPIPSGMPHDQLKKLFQAALQVTAKMHEAGVDILVGTDHRALPGAAMHTEMSLLAEAGIPNGQVIHLATANAATVMGLEKRYGSIAPGKVADLVLLNQNPLEDIGHTADIHAVVSRGVYYPRETLLKSTR